MTTKALRAKRQAAKKRRQITLWVSLVGTAIVLVGGYLLFGLNLQKGADTRFEAGKPGKGAPAPDFSLPAVGGVTFSLAEYRGQKNVLLFFQEGVG